MLLNTVAILTLRRKEVQQEVCLSLLKRAGFNMPLLIRAIIWTGPTVVIRISYQQKYCSKKTVYSCHRLYKIEMNLFWSHLIGQLLCVVVNSLCLINVNCSPCPLGYPLSFFVPLDWQSVALDGHGHGSDIQRREGEKNSLSNSYPFSPFETHSLLMRGVYNRNRHWSNGICWARDGWHSYHWAVKALSHWDNLGIKVD